MLIFRMAYVVAAYLTVRASITLFPFGSVRILNIFYHKHRPKDSHWSSYSESSSPYYCIFQSIPQSSDP